MATLIDIESLETPDSPPQLPNVVLEHSKPNLSVTEDKKWYICTTTNPCDKNDIYSTETKCIFVPFVKSSGTCAAPKGGICYGTLAQVLNRSICKGKCISYFCHSASSNDKYRYISEVIIPNTKIMRIDNIDPNNLRSNHLQIVSVHDMHSVDVCKDILNRETGLDFGLMIFTIKNCPFDVVEYFYDEFRSRFTERGMKKILMTACKFDSEIIHKLMLCHSYTPKNWLKACKKAIMCKSEKVVAALMLDCVGLQFYYKKIAKFAEQQDCETALVAAVNEGVDLRNYLDRKSDDENLMSSTQELIDIYRNHNAQLTEIVSISGKRKRLQWLTPLMGEIEAEYIPVGNEYDFNVPFNPSKVNRRE